MKKDINETHFLTRYCSKFVTVNGVSRRSRFQNVLRLMSSFTIEDVFMFQIITLYDFAYAKNTMTPLLLNTLERLRPMSF